MELTREQVKDWLSKQSVLELSALTKELEEAWGVSAAAAVAVAAAPGAAAAAPVVEAPTEFNAVLVEAGAEKIKVIKVVREITALGLKEAKDLVDGIPKNIKESIPKDEAEAIKKKFEEVGAKVEIKPA